MLSYYYGSYTVVYPYYPTISDTILCFNWKTKCLQSIKNHLKNRYPYHCGLFIMLDPHETIDVIVVFPVFIPHDTQNLFLKYPAPNKGLNETYHLARLLLYLKSTDDNK